MQKYMKVTKEQEKGWLQNAVGFVATVNTVPLFTLKINELLNETPAVLLQRVYHTSLWFVTDLWSYFVRNMYDIQHTRPRSSWPQHAQVDTLELVNARPDHNSFWQQTEAFIDHRSFINPWMSWTFLSCPEPVLSCPESRKCQYFTHHQNHSFINPTHISPAQFLGKTSYWKAPAQFKSRIRQKIYCIMCKNRFPTHTCGHFVLSALNLSAILPQTADTFVDFSYVIAMFWVQGEGHGLGRCFVYIVHEWFWRVVNELVLWMTRCPDVYG